MTPERCKCGAEVVVVDIERASAAAAFDAAIRYGLGPTLANIAAQGIGRRVRKVAATATVCPACLLRSVDTAAVVQ